QQGTGRWVEAAVVQGLFPTTPAKDKTASEMPTRASPVEPVEAKSSASPPDTPSHIGRYRAVGLLGEGGFGRGYLAHDDQLHRPAAIQVPHRQRLPGTEGAEAYLNEARTVAGLDHPNIVPVYDVGRTEDGLCFVVSKFIQGSDLSKWLKEARPTFSDTA